MTKISSKRIGLHYESWLEALVDEGSYKAIVSDENSSVFSGLALINEKKVAIYGHNPKIEQGFVNSVGAHQILELMKVAEELKIPIISLCASAGVSVLEGLASGHAYTKVIVKNIELSGIIPQISIIISQTMGAPAYSATLTDFVLFNKSRSSLMVTGPGVIEQVLGEKVSVRDLGGSEVHAQKTGIADFVDKDISLQLKRARALVSFLPTNNKSHPDKRLSARALQSYPEFSKNIKDVFEIEKFLLGLCDSSEYMEFRKEYGESVLCSFAYIGGHAFGVMANRSMINAGALDCDASFKASRFLRLCDCYNLPILNLIDVPGFLPGIEQEHLGLLKNGARLCQAMQTSTPRFSVILRKCYGAAAFIMMQSKAQGGEYVFALKEARIAVMGYSGAMSMFNEGLSCDEYYDKYENPMIAKELGIVDEIIELGQLRQRLIAKIEESYASDKMLKRIEAKKTHQVFA